VEGVTYQLDPDFNLAKYMTEYLSETKDLRMFGMKKMGDIKGNVMAIIDSIGKLPQAISNFSRNLTDGAITIEIQHQNLEELRLEFEKISNRLSASILLAAILVGSALIMLTGEGPLLFGFPIVGIIGFLGAMLLGFWMVLRIIRKSGI
jgi:ubiquinone biosynthesis protein